MSNKVSCCKSGKRANSRIGAHAAWECPGQTVESPKSTKCEQMFGFRKCGIVHSFANEQTIVR